MPDKKDPSQENHQLKDKYITIAPYMGGEFLLLRKIRIRFTLFKSLQDNQKKR